MAHPKLLWLALMVVPLVGCRSTYRAPTGRTTPSLRTTDWGRTDPGDAPAIRQAENRCLQNLSPRAVSAAFRAVDEVADALSDLCTISIVDDDPLLWHVFCGSDALFAPGDFRPPEDRQLSCADGRPGSAFECIGRTLAQHLLDRNMRQHVRAVEIVSVGSVDAQSIHAQGQFLGDPCPQLQEELALPQSARWVSPEEEPSREERMNLWNRRLSWCRAAHSARSLRTGMASAIGGNYELSALGAGTAWLDHYRATNRGGCPSPVAAGPGRASRCRDARRVDLFIRVDAREGRASARTCTPPEGLGGGESGRALYCYSECQAQAAVGRNPQGYSAPRSRQDLLFGAEGSGADLSWIGGPSSNQRGVNRSSIRDLLFSSRH